MMTVRQLREELNGHLDEAAVVMSKDEKGTDFAVAYSMSASQYVLRPEEIRIPVVILWPKRPSGMEGLR